MTALPVIEHTSRIVRINTVPGIESWQWVCSCGAASPFAHNKDVALIAKRAHLREIGRGMSRPRLLDLFCCEGGAAVGYARAGFTVTGVDIKPKRRYPFLMFADDALDFLRRWGDDYDVIHASPPCQAYTRGNAGRETAWPRLIEPVRDLLRLTGKPYIIENVADAASELRNPVKLCGCMFDLSTIDADGVRIHLQRARLFETNFPLTAPRECDHTDHKWVAGAYGGARRDKHEARYIRKGGYVPPNKDVVKRLLGIEHDMTWNGLFESIPPAYTEHIGLQLIDHLQAMPA